MMKKFGVNSTRSEKSGPKIKKGIALRKSKIITCECGAKLEKCCDNDLTCEISVLKCPKCGRDVS